MEFLLFSCKRLCTVVLGYPASNWTTLAPHRLQHKQKFVLVCDLLSGNPRHTFVMRNKYPCFYHSRIVAVYFELVRCTIQKKPTILQIYSFMGCMTVYVVNWCISSAFVDKESRSSLKYICLGHINIPWRLKGTLNYPSRFQHIQRKNNSTVWCSLFFFHYRQQTKFAKAMFLHLSVSHSFHKGGLPQCMLG